MHDDTDNDDKLFQKAMRDVRPLKQEQRIHAQPKKITLRPRQHEDDVHDLIQDGMSDPVDLADLETGDELLFYRSGIQHKTLRKLRRGDFAIEAELDLHGKTVTEARSQIAEFLNFCPQNGHRCVRIIHGKGHGSHNKQPILKTHINHWLPQRSEVLAFCSCRPADGGTGAIYLLIRKK